MDTATDPQRHDDVTHEPEGVPTGLVLGALAVTVVISVVLCLLAWLLLRFREGQLRPGGAFPERTLGAPHRVANVREAMWKVTAPRPPIQAAQRESLDKYGWIDEKSGIAHVPVSRAIERLLEEEGGR